MDNNKKAIVVLDDFFGDDELTFDMSAREAWDCIKRLLKEQGQIVRCKDCRWYDEKISFCDNSHLPREQTFFCADGGRKTNRDD